MSHRQLILIGFLSLFGTVAHAQSAATADADTTANATKVDAAASTSGSDRSRCLTDTGSAIKRAPGNCMPVNGRSYTREDIDRTGATTVGGALTNLDPSITSR